MRKNLKTVLGICLVCAGTFASTTTLQAKKKVAYLFTYFTGNAPEQEQICYAISTDGFSYTPLNDGNPVISSDTISLKKGVRDPHILRGEDGYFYMVVTDMRSSQGWTSNRGIVLMRSKDMVNWTHHTVNFPEKYAGTMFANVIRVWAPQTIYDKKAKKYMVYFSILTDDGQCPYDKVFWAYANEDFSDLEGEPKVLFDYKKPSIDTDIVQWNLSHLFQNRRRAEKRHPPIFGQRPAQSGRMGTVARHVRRYRQSGGRFRRVPTDRRRLGIDVRLLHERALPVLHQQRPDEVQTRTGYGHAGRIHSAPRHGHRHHQERAETPAKSFPKHEINKRPTHYFF